jgi:hypothetical protein
MVRTKAEQLAEFKGVQGDKKFILRIGKEEFFVYQDDYGFDIIDTYLKTLGWNGQFSRECYTDSGYIGIDES